MGEGVSFAKLVVGRKPRLSHPPVIPLPAIGMKLRTPCEPLAIDTIVEVSPVAASVAEASQSLIEAPAPDRDERAMRTPGAHGNDVDYAVNGVGSPNSASRAADDFDPFDILEQNVLDLPI